MADLAGNDDAFRRWALSVMRARLGRTAVDRPQRIRYQASDDLAFVGVRNVISLPGGQLEAILGVEANVDETLSGGDPADVLAAQLRITNRGLRSRHSERHDTSIISLADDGSALILNRL